MGLIFWKASRKTNAYRIISLFQFPFLLNLQTVGVYKFEQTISCGQLNRQSKGECGNCVLISQ